LAATNFEAPKRKTPLLCSLFSLLKRRPRPPRAQVEDCSALKTGDRVITSSGIHGLISNVKDTTVIVKVADNVKLEIEKTAVTNVVKSVEGS
jgi:preprotein translocase subunit YajC